MGGLFATRRISPEDIVTLYPGDALRYYPVTETGVSPTRSGVKFADHVPSSMRNAEAVLGKYRPYAYDIDGYYAAVGLPELSQNPAYQGHMCNDGATLQPGGALSKYTSDSTANNNASLECLLDGLVVVIASRVIEEGEEVLVSYGAEYWMTLHLMLAEEKAAVNVEGNAAAAGGNTAAAAAATPPTAAPVCTGEMGDERASSLKRACVEGAVEHPEVIQKGGGGHDKKRRQEDLPEER